MVSICVINEVERAINTVSDELIKEYEAYASSENSTVHNNSNKNYYANNQTQNELLYENTAMFNTFIHSPNIIKKITPITYPNINNRITKNNFITPYEVDKFIEQSMTLTESTFLKQIFKEGSISEFRIKARDYENTDFEYDIVTDVLELSNDEVSERLVLEEFEYYLGSLFETDESVSSFCAMIPSIFEKLERYANVFNGFKQMAGYISDKISSLSGKVAGQSFSQLNKTVTVFVEKTFKEQIERLKKYKITLTDEFSKMNTRISANFIKLRDKAENFFTEENLETIKNSISAQIQYVLDFFKDPDLKEIQYIIYRFCTLLTTLKHVFSSQITPLSKAVQAYNETNLALKTAGNLKTANAIRAGAIRFTPQEYDAVKSEQFNFIRSRSEQENGNYNPRMIEITPMDIEGVTPWNNGQGDSRVGFQGGWVTALGVAGWNQVDSRVKIMLMQVQEAFGKRLLVNSAFRPDWYNKKVGGASGSMHKSGLALDITWNGFNMDVGKNKFVPICKQVGFRGFGYYPRKNFIHIDIGDARQWNG